MSKPKPLTKPVQGLATLERPQFFPGLLLEDEDLTASVEYTRNMVRLLFRSLFGCGVICGLDVAGELICEGRQVKISVRKGIALDCMGNPIEIPRDVEVIYDPDCKPPAKQVWVAVCYLEKCCRPRDVSCGADDNGQSKYTRAHGGYEVRVYDSIPTGACSCEKPDPPPSTTRPGCCEDEQQEAAVADAPAATTEEPKRPTPPCDCYSDHIAGKCTCDCGSNCVVVGKLSIDWNTKVVKPAKEEIRRLIRPIPIGFLDCIKGRPATEPEEEPPVEIG